MSKETCHRRNRKLESPILWLRKISLTLTKKKRTRARKASMKVSFKWLLPAHATRALSKTRLETMQLALQTRMKPPCSAFTKPQPQQESQSTLTKMWKMMAKSNQWRLRISTRGRHWSRCSVSSRTGRTRCGWIYSLWRRQLLLSNRRLTLRIRLLHRVAVVVVAASHQLQGNNNRNQLVMEMPWCESDSYTLHLIIQITHLLML